MNTNDKMQPTSSASSARQPTNPDELSSEEREAIIMLKMATAMRRAFDYGQTYFSQADSESYSQNAKSDVTAANFAAFITDTCEELRSVIVPPVVQAPTDDEISIAWDLMYPSDKNSRHNALIFARAMLDKQVAAPIVATVPSEPVARLVPLLRNAIGILGLRVSNPAVQTVINDMQSYIDGQYFTAGVPSQHWLDAAKVAAPSPTEQASDVRNADCYSHNDGDSWCDCPDDIVFVHGLKVGDEYEVLASVRAWTERYRVTKAPDDDSDDYEVERVATPADKGNAPDEAKS